MMKKLIVMVALLGAARVASAQDPLTNAKKAAQKAKAATDATQMRTTTFDKDSALFWADRGVGYVVSGGNDHERLAQVARAVYDQVEKSGG